jgi:AmiR/NasT family two-component response regulator
MHAGGGIIGAVSLYRRWPGPLTEPLDNAQFLADAAAAALIRDPLAFAAYTTSAESGGWSSRAQIHQASGMLASKLHISVDDAFVLLRSHAFTAGIELSDVAAAVVERKLDLSGE